MRRSHWGRMQQMNLTAGLILYPLRSEKQRWITAMVPSNPETSGDQISENGGEYGADKWGRVIHDRSNSSQLHLQRALSLPCLHLPKKCILTPQIKNLLKKVGSSTAFSE